MSTSGSMATKRLYSTGVEEVALGIEHVVQQCAHVPGVAGRASGKIGDGSGDLFVGPLAGTAVQLQHVNGHRNAPSCSRSCIPTTARVDSVRGSWARRVYASGRAEVTN